MIIGKITSQQPLFTVANIAIFIGISPASVKQIFYLNKDLFIKGKHYFKLCGDDLQTFIKHYQIDSSTVLDPVLLIFTLQGLSRFTDSIIIKKGNGTMIHFKNGKLSTDNTDRQILARRQAKRIILIIRFFLFFVLLVSSMALILLVLMLALKLIGGQ